MRTKCSVPWPFKEWFYNSFEDICEDHDVVYEVRKYRDSIVLDHLDKVGADLVALGRIVKRQPVRGGLFTLTVCTIALPFVLFETNRYWYTE